MSKPEGKFIHDRKFWLEFINEYKNVPCLWDVNNVYFSNKKYRNQALLSLLDKVRQVWSEANIEFVKQRISNFRRTFLNEYKKVQESKQNGTNKVYVPNMYYFEHLKFLKEDEEFDSNTTVNEVAKDKFCNTVVMSSVADEDFVPNKKRRRPSSSFNETYYEKSTKEGIPKKHTKLMRETPLTKKNNNALQINTNESTLDDDIEFDSDQIELEADYSEIDALSEEEAGLSSSMQYNDEDDFDVIAKRVATHFRHMNAEQCLYAEKLVFDVCISGRLNRLSESSTLLVKCKPAFALKPNKNDEPPTQ